MGPNCAPLLADLFPIPMRMSFSDKLIKKGKRKLSRKFNFSYSHIDDLISFDNKIFEEFISDIYQRTFHTQPVLALKVRQCSVVLCSNTQLRVGYGTETSS